MSLISEWWEGSNDVQKAVGIAGVLALAGLSTEAGRAGFKEGPIEGVGTAIGKGIYIIGGVPVTFAKSLAEGIGILKAPDADKADVSGIEKLGLSTSDLQGLAAKLSGKEEEKKTTARNTIVTVLIIVVVLFVALLLIKALSK